MTTRRERMRKDGKGPRRAREGMNKEQQAREGIERDVCSLEHATLCSCNMRIMRNGGASHTHTLAHLTDLETWQGRYFSSSHFSLSCSPSLHRRSSSQLGPLISQRPPFLSVFFPPLPPHLAISVEIAQGQTSPTFDG